MSGPRRDGPLSSIFDPSFDFRSLGSMPSMWDALNLIDNFAARNFARDSKAMACTRVDWVESKEEHVFKADLPGLKKEEIKVQLLDDRVLEISGERTKEEERRSDTWHRIERSSGKFLRRFRLPDNTQTDRLSAKVEDGVLTVIVPKIPEQTPHVRTIEIS